MVVSAYQTVEGKRKLWASEDGSGGWVTLLPEFLLSAHQHPTFKNCDVASPAGIRRKRKGRTKFSATLSTLTGDGSVSGLRIIRLDPTASAPGGTVINVASEGTTIQKFTGTTWTAINQAGASSKPALNNDVWFEQFLNTMIATSAGMNPQKWDGVAATTSDIGTTMPAGIPTPNGAEFCFVYATSVWYAGGNDTSQQATGEYSSLWKSAVGTVDTFNTANDSFFARLNPGDGDKIMGCAVVSDYCVIAKQNHIYILTGTTFDSYAILKHRQANRGLISKRGFTTYSGLFIYAANDGIYAVGPDSFSEISEPIRPNYLAIADKTTVTLGTYLDQIWVSYKDTGDAQNASGFVLDIKRGLWEQHPAGTLPVREFHRDINGNLYGGLATAGTTTKVMQFDQGTQDEGTNITQTVETPDLDFENFPADKQPLILWLWLKPAAAGSGATVQVDLLVDGLVQGSPFPFTISIDPSNASFNQSFVSGQSQMLVRTPLPETSRGRLLRVRITDANNFQSVIYGIALEADVFEPVLTDVQV